MAKRADLNKIFKQIREENKSYRIKIRVREGKKGYAFFLDYWHNGRHETYFYPKKYTGLVANKIIDNQLLKDIEKDRSDKDYELFANENNFRLKNDFSKADFIEFYKRVGVKKGSRPQYTASLKHFLDFIKVEKIQFRELSPELFKKFREYLLSRVSDITARGYLDVMRAGLNIAIEHNVIQDNPLKGIDIKVEDTKKEYLTEKELIAFINQDTKHIQSKNAFLFSCFTGLRLGDVLSLTFDQIQEGEIHFRQQKTKKIEAFPLAEDAQKIIEYQLNRKKKTVKVFDLPKSKSSINRYLKQIIKEAGITKNIHYHCSRHTFAIRCLNSGMSIYEVSKFLGHSDIKTTEVYLQFVQEHKQRAIGKLPRVMG